MVAPDIIPGNGIAKRINVFCLLVAIIVVFVLPLRKYIWYDETVSVLCSKGISHDSQYFLFTNTNSISSAQVDSLNTANRVFKATVIDNGNSFLYNMGLHWFTAMTGNKLSAYLLFSKLCAIAALISFFMLCKLALKNSIFTSIAILLLVADGNFINMSYEIRAYSMGILFVTLAAVYLYKFLNHAGRPAHLLATGLFSAAAILSHFLSVYIIIVFVFALIFYKRLALFSVRNILAILVPAAIMVIYFYFAMAGLREMNLQNKAIEETSSGFSLAHVLMRSLWFSSLNFKVVYPFFKGNDIITICSFLFVIALYVAAIRVATSKTERRTLHLLFILGISSTIFLAALSIKAHHYTSLYHRYYSFGIPFSCLFIAYALYVISWSAAVNKVVKGVAIALVFIPSCVLFAYVIRTTATVKYNHVDVAERIANQHVSRLGMPTWRDAFLIQSFLPQGYKIDYFRNPADHDFVLYMATGEERIPVIKEDH